MIFIVVICSSSKREKKLDQIKLVEHEQMSNTHNFVRTQKLKCVKLRAIYLLAPSCTVKKETKLAIFMLQDYWTDMNLKRLFYRWTGSVAFRRMGAGMVKGTPGGISPAFLARSNISQAQFRSEARLQVACQPHARTMRIVLRKHRRNISMNPNCSTTI